MASNGRGKLLRHAQVHALVTEVDDLCRAACAARITLTPWGPRYQGGREAAWISYALRTCFVAGGSVALAFSANGRVLTIDAAHPGMARTLEIERDQRAQVCSVLPWAQGFAVVAGCVYLCDADGNRLSSSMTRMLYCFPLLRPERLLWSRIEGTVGTWSPTAEAKLFQVGSPVTALVEIEQDRLFLAGASNGEAYLWEAGSSLPITTFRGHRNAVVSVALSPEGRRIATGSDDGTARVWDRATGKQLLELRHEGNVRRVVFTPDGRQLVTACNDGCVRWWLLDAGELRAAVEAMAGEELTAGERERFGDLLR